MTSASNTWLNPTELLGLSNFPCSSSPLPSTPGTKVRGPWRVQGAKEWRHGIVGGGQGHRSGLGLREGA